MPLNLEIKPLSLLKTPKITQACIINKNRVGNRSGPYNDSLIDGANRTQPLAPDPTSTSPLRTSTRPSKPPNRYGFSNVSLIANLASISIPNSYSQAMVQPLFIIATATHYRLSS